jgi:RNA ligase (TIGR02306 family)
MERKLASVQKIWKIEPIEGADRIEVVSVLGWKCVTKKGEFKVGDPCIYFEVDSFLPIHPKFEFLRASCYKKNDLMGEGFLLKTQRFRGQVSQGLVLPLSILLDFGRGVVCTEDDVTDLLGVRKWSMPEVATGSGTSTYRRIQRRSLLHFDKDGRHQRHHVPH